MWDLQETVTYAFLSYDTVLTTGKKCSLGAFSVSARLRFLMWAPHVTFGSGP